MSKTYIDANQLLSDAFALTKLIHDSDFKPTVLIALWRGGTPIGIAVQEGLAFLGIDTQHFALRTRYYADNNQRTNSVQIDNLSYIGEHLSNTDRLLIVDDVFDSGNTVQALLNKIHSDSSLPTPCEIKIATPYFKPQQNQTNIKPDFYLHETNEWIVFPHKLSGLSEHEIKLNKPYASILLDVKTDE